MWYVSFCSVRRTFENKFLSDSGKVSEDLNDINCSAEVLFLNDNSFEAACFRELRRRPFAKETSMVNGGRDGRLKFSSSYTSGVGTLRSRADANRRIGRPNVWAEIKVVGVPIIEDGGRKVELRACSDKMPGCSAGTKILSPSSSLELRESSLNLFSSSINFSLISSSEYSLGGRIRKSLASMIVVVGCGVVGLAVFVVVVGKLVMGMDEMINGTLMVISSILLINVSVI